MSGICEKVIGIDLGGIGGIVGMGVVGIGVVGIGVVGTGVVGIGVVGTGVVGIGDVLLRYKNIPTMIPIEMIEMISGRCIYFNNFNKYNL
jgi:hypothetical protein